MDSCILSSGVRRYHSFHESESDRASSSLRSRSCSVTCNARSGDMENRHQSSILPEGLDFPSSMARWGLLDRPVPAQYRNLALKVVGTSREEELVDCNRGRSDVRLRMQHCSFRSTWVHGAVLLKYSLGINEKRCESNFVLKTLWNLAIAESSRFEGNRARSALFARRKAALRRVAASRSSMPQSRRRLRTRFTGRLKVRSATL